MRPLQGEDLVIAHYGTMFRYPWESAAKFAGQADLPGRGAKRTIASPAAVTRGAGRNAWP